MKIDAHILERLLARWPVARLAVGSGDEPPHLLPVVFVAEAGTVYSPVDGKRKDGRPLARVRAVAREGRATLLLDQYHDDWSRLWWVRLDGEARVERANVALLDHVGERLREKYPQYREVAPYAGPPTLLALQWRRVRAWSQSGGDVPLREAAGLP
jgi:PPOX class probable F420-dependent enzyme